MTVASRRRIQYEDFALEILPQDGGYGVRVRAPFHGPESPFQPPFDPSETERIMAVLERTVRGSGLDLGRDLKTAAPEEAALPSASDVGAALFQSLFPGPVLERFLLRRGQAAAREGCGLRIRLLLDPSRPELAVLCSLPWELLYRDGFLSRDVLTPVVRCLDTRSPWAGTPAPVGDRLRILVAMASPPGYAPLDLPRERRRIEEAWGGIDGMEIAFLVGATLAGLRQELRDSPFEVLHFMGHGALDHESGEGLLLFEDPQGGAHLVSGAMLAETCRGPRGLRMVFLNACDTGRLPRRGGQDPFTGAASALVMSGAPAVVAMQFPISDAAAVAFSGAVYTALAAGDPVDAAVAEGRLAVYQSSPSSLEWATPVLFLSTAEGVVHELERARGQRSWLAAAPAVAAMLVLLTLAVVLWVAHHRAAVQRQAAFSLGASLAMLGQSSEAAGRPIFERELARLDLEPNEEKVLFETYQKLEENRQAERIGSAELAEGVEQLRRVVAVRLQMLAGAGAVPYMVLGYNVSHLYLVLGHWDQLETQSAARVAANDIKAILTIAPQVQLSAEIRQAMEGLGSRDLERQEERAAVLQTLGEILRFFQRDNQGG